LLSLLYDFYIVITTIYLTPDIFMLVGTHNILLKKADFMFVMITINVKFLK